MKKRKTKNAPVRRALPGTASRPPLARMLRIHEELQRAVERAGAPVNCSSLAADLEVSAKTVQRDIDFMRDRLGLPVEYDPSTKAFRYTRPVAQFPTVQITEGELVALAVARQALEQYRGTPFARPLRAAFHKLTAGLKDHIQFAWFNEEGEDGAGRTGGETDNTSISFRSSVAGRGVVTDLEAFETASRATLAGEEVEFLYQKLGAERPESRRVRPLHLACVDNAWYLFGLDVSKPDAPLRTFALSRLGKVRGTGVRFERPEGGFSLERHLADSFGVFAPAGVPQEVRLRFDAFAGRLISERVWHGSQRLEPRAESEGGGVDLTLTVSLSPEVERWILSWGEHVEVLGPGELRGKVARVAVELAARYQPI